MATAHQFVGEICNDPLGATIELGWNALIQRGNLCNP
jgi:hypothetical protein